jgi:hypothetical protein
MLNGRNNVARCRHFSSMLAAQTTRLIVAGVLSLIGALATFSSAARLTAPAVTFSRLPPAESTMFSISARRLQVKN